MELYHTLIVFIPTFFFISITPGINMLAALNMGTNYGYLRAFPFIMGGAFGVALVAICTMMGINEFLSKIPNIYTIMKLLGFVLLVYFGWITLKSKKIKYNDNLYNEIKSVHDLMIKGFLTAVLNPKAWLFFIAIMPSLLNIDAPSYAQIMTLALIVFSIEIFCMSVYSSGGNLITAMVKSEKQQMKLNKISASAYFIMAALLLVQ